MEGLRPVTGQGPGAGDGRPLPTPVPVRPTGGTSVGRWVLLIVVLLLAWAIATFLAVLGYLAGAGLAGSPGQARYAVPYLLASALVAGAPLLSAHAIVGMARRRAWATAVAVALAWLAVAGLLTLLS